MRRVGFIINSRVPCPAALASGMRPHQWLTGWDDSCSPMSFMRFRWVAEEVNRAGEIRYEIYKPWRHYDAVVFLKSMGTRCEEKMRSLQTGGTRVVFEANVDYYTEAPAANLPGELAPTPEQRRTAIAMTSHADATIASSRRLGEICSHYGTPARFVPDNIPPALVPSGDPQKCVQDGRLHLWWSGMATKLYDFLLIERVLRARSARLHLHFVTNGAGQAADRWPVEQAKSFSNLLSTVPHTFHPYQCIPELMKLYHTGGGIIVSPRFLESPYNHSHTEWKLTLGLACGLPGIGSPQPSYEDAAALSNGRALTICRDETAWADTLDAMLENPERTWQNGVQGREAILGRYGTPHVAAEHRAVLKNLLS